MGLPRLQSCCCGLLDLKTGNLVLGGLNAALSLALTITMCVSAALLAGLEVEGEDAEARAAVTGAYVMAIILVFLFLAKFAFDLLFVYGVVTERGGVIKAYFVMWVVFFLLSVSTFFLNTTHFAAATVTSELFYIGVNVYAILLSHSFYRQLNEREEV